jgi:hypothetical protein
MQFLVGHVIDVTNDHGTKRYMITNTHPNGITLVKTMMGKTKISAVRFPERISICIKGQALIGKKKVSKSKIK